MASIHFFFLISPAGNRCKQMLASIASEVPHTIHQSPGISSLKHIYCRHHSFQFILTILSRKVRATIIWFLQIDNWLFLLSQHSMKWVDFSIGNSVFFPSWWEKYTPEVTSSSSLLIEKFQASYGGQAYCILIVNEKYWLNLKKVFTVFRVPFLFAITSQLNKTNVYISITVSTHLCFTWLFNLHWRTFRYYLNASFRLF